MSSYLVSPCCGANYEEDTYTNCCSAVFIEETDICSRCKEHADISVEYVCDECNEWFPEPDVDYEWEDRTRENAEEAKWEEKTGR